MGVPSVVVDGAGEDKANGTYKCVGEKRTKCGIKTFIYKHTGENWHCQFLELTNGRPCWYIFPKPIKDDTIFFEAPNHGEQTPPTKGWKAYSWFFHDRVHGDPTVTKLKT